MTLLYHIILFNRFRDEVEISADKRHDIKEVDTTHTLTIKDLQESDDAEYMATASNSAGSVSTMCEVLVNPAPVPGWWTTHLTAALQNQSHLIDLTNPIITLHNCSTAIAFMYLVYLSKMYTSICVASSLCAHGTHHISSATKYKTSAIGKPLLL